MNHLFLHRWVHRVLHARSLHVQPARVPWRRGPGLIAVLLGLGLLAPALPAAPVTFTGLLDEMVQLPGLAEFPDPAYTCRQFSSYDRNARSPQEDWFANNDRGQYLRVEERDGRREYVMMDAAGPGAVVRIWSANPEGNLRIYVDEGEEPVLRAPMSELLGGGFPGLPRPLAGEYSKGWNLYLPIPYARHCKITSDKGDFYYHVNYRTYAPGTTVESFTAQHLAGAAAQLRSVVTQLNAPDSVGPAPAGQVESFEFELPAGGGLEQTLPGPAAIARVVLRIPAADEAILRGLVVRVDFDGERCVETPLGDFFGTAPGLNAYAGLPLGVTESGDMVCRWLMPFRDEARIVLDNTTSVPVTLRGEITLQPYRWTERSMLFHAKWRSQLGVPTRPMIDWNYLHVQGRGVFAGVAFAIDNPVKEWWGEGDEKIYVDGEVFPSHFGTGTEDYYGYAWCWPEVFTHPYHAQPRCDGPGNYGRTSVNRFHILDRIPFAKDFRFDMELWHWNDHCQVNLAVVGYWYARPGGRDDFPPVRDSDAVVQPLAAYVVPKVPGAIEGETMRVVSVNGTVNPQDWDGLSGGRQLWWHAGMKSGDRLVLAFECPQAGRTRVIGHFLKARDYGIHQLAINGRPVGGPVDFFHPQVVPSGEVELGVFDLKSGNNELSVTVVGANPQAIPTMMFGLDYLRLQPVE